jgi:arginine repressor
MTRSLTKDQRARRGAILDRFGEGHTETARQLRSYLAQYQRTFVTVATVQRDLKAMERAGSVRITHVNLDSTRVWGAVYHEQE